MKEKEIRDTKVLDEYLKMARKDAEDYFDFASFTQVRCPACGGSSHAHEFDKSGFKYVSCRTCSTLFINPRPSPGALARFYADSPSASFWVNRFFKPVAEARREKIFRPRAEYIRDLFSGCKALTIGDIGAGFGLFLEELRRLLPENVYVAVEPSLEMSDICRKNGFETICACLEDIKCQEERFDILTVFELMEHICDPAAFLKKVNMSLKPGGRLFLTTLNGMGFDILMLWEKSKSVTPPHHLNFFNPLSIRRLLEKAGFAVDEISTPGRLDWDIVEGMMRNEAFDAGRLWRHVAEGWSDRQKQELQGWICRNNLSSHMRVAARKQRAYGVEI